MNKILSANIFKFISLISIIILILLLPEKFEIFDNEKIIIYNFISCFNIVVFFQTNKKYFDTWFRYDTLFILGYVIVHFQIPFLAGIGIEPERADHVWINKMVVNYAMWLSSIVLLLWMLGFSLYLVRFSKKDRINLKSFSYKINVIKIDYILSFVFVLFIVLVGNEFLSGVYNGGNNWGGGASYVFVILKVLLNLRIVYFFMNNKGLSNRTLLLKLSNNKVFISILLLYVSVFLIAGDRGPIMDVTIITLGSYTIYIKKVSFRALFLMVLVGASLFTIISLGRTSEYEGLDNSNIFDRGLKKLETTDNPFNPTDELATSVRILYRALDVVPDQHPYLYGTTFFFNIVAMVPFGTATIVELTDLPLMYQSSTTFFTVLGQGTFYTYGEGSEVIGDLYINFGIYGVFIIMFFFGYFVCYISMGALYLKKHSLIIIFLFLMITAIYISRSVFLVPLRDIVYALVIDRFLTKKIKLG